MNSLKLDQECKSQSRRWQPKSRRTESELNTNPHRPIWVTGARKAPLFSFSSCQDLLVLWARIWRQIFYPLDRNEAEKNILSADGIYLDPSCPHTTGQAQRAAHVEERRAGGRKDGIHRREGGTTCCHIVSNWKRNFPMKQWEHSEWQSGRNTSNRLSSFNPSARDRTDTSRGGSVSVAPGFAETKRRHQQQLVSKVLLIHYITKIKCVNVGSATRWET